MVKSSTSIRSSLRPHQSECGPGCRCHRNVETEEQSAEFQQHADPIENFLVRVLGLEEEVARRDAYGLRYVLSARTVQKMAAYCRQLSESGNNTRS